MRLDTPQHYSKLIVERIGPRKWRLAEPFVTPFGFIPEGFVTDGATIPRPFWVLATPAGEAFEAAVLHDWMLQEKMYTAAEAHKGFRLALISYGVGRLKAWLLYQAVRSYGALKYGNDRRVVR